MPQPAKPILAVTMGDPAGVGPEVIVGAWGDERVHRAARPIVVGHPEILRRAASLLKRDVRVQEVASVSDVDDESESATIPCLKVCDDDALDVRPGLVDARAGEAAYRAVCAAANLALASEVEGIVTAPLSKAALHAAGHRYPGHTELLAEMCRVVDFAMMLYLPRVEPCATARYGGGSVEHEIGTACLPTPHEVSQASSAASSGDTKRSSASSGTLGGGLGVVHVTLHQSLRSVFADLTTDAIVAKCRLVDAVMRRLGVEQPRLAVCALNPHAGEDALFGDEELTIIAPAIAIARAAGIDAMGPMPADTLMLRAKGGEFDAVVAMYHDQGHIAIKLLGMHAAVNITLGLPIVRTSVAHGTAFDRAWQGSARSEGMVAAILTAAKLSESRHAPGKA